MPVWNDGSDRVANASGFDHVSGVPSWVGAAETRNVLRVWQAALDAAAHTAPGASRAS